jgi:hypothetical protein
LRFTRTPMNRATAIRVVAAITLSRWRQSARRQRIAFVFAATFNAVRTARIYIRQARHSFRHLVSVDFSEAVAPCYARADVKSEDRAAIA